MARIVAIHRHKRNRVIVLDDGTTFDAPPIICARFQFSMNMEISRDKLEEIIRESDRENAMQYSFFLLSRRDYSQQDMRRKFKRKDFHPEVIEEVLSLLEKKGYLDDEKLMKRLFEYYLQERKAGRLYVIMKLVEKGFPRENIEAILLTYDDEKIDWEQENCNYWGKKWIQKKGKKSVRELDMKQRQSLFQYLVNKGFSARSVTGFVNED